MNQHTEFELLSAFIDGELDANEQERVAAHLPSCAGCRQMLEALTSTMTDFKSVETPQPSAQDSWALRSAIASARAAGTKRGRVPRLATALAGVAAVLAGITISITSLTNSAKDAASPATFAEAGGARSENADYDQTSATQLLATRWRSFQRSTDSAGTGPKSGDPAPAAASAPAQSDLEASYDRSLQTLGRCQSAIPPAGGTLEDAFQATYEGTPAYFFILRVPADASQRLELWVMSVDTCDVLFWAEQQLNR